MKAYIGLKKVDGNYRYGLTVYSEQGYLLHSSTKHEDIKENKFENALLAINWGAKKLKTLTQNKVLDDQEGITLIIASKTIYTWFEKQVAPSPYTGILSDILLDMSFLFNPLEIIFSKAGDKRVVYKNSQEEVTKLTDFLTPEPSELIKA
jgi:hypothetical protein